MAFSNYGVWKEKVSTLYVRFTNHPLSCALPVLEANSPKIVKADDVNLMVIARGTPGFSGAELANLVNIAALKAAMGGANSVTMEEVKELLERAYAKAKTILTTHSRELHALAAALLEPETLSGSQIKDLLTSLNTQKQQPQVLAAAPQTSAPPVPAPPPSSSSPSAAAAAAKAKGVAQPVVGS